MQHYFDDYRNISNSDYIWRCEGKIIVVKKIYSKSKRFIIRTIFFISFFYIGVFSGIIGSLYSLAYLMETMHITSLILNAVSFPISGYYLKKVNVVKIDTKLKNIIHSKVIWIKKYHYLTSADFIRNKSFVGGRFQASIETLSIKSQEGKIYKVAQIAMPDKNGFQPIIDAIQKLESAN